MLCTSGAEQRGLKEAAQAFLSLPVACMLSARQHLRGGGEGGLPDGGGEAGR